MQGLADGYFILPVTIGDYLAPLLGQTPLDTGAEPFAAAEDAGPRARAALPLAASGEHSVDWFHRELGKVLWDACGMARNGPGLEHAMAEIADAARALQGRRAGARRRRDARTSRWRRRAASTTSSRSRS